MSKEIVFSEVIEKEHKGNMRRFVRIIFYDEETKRATTEEVVIES